MLRVIGLDPGLRHTGWGIITCEGDRTRFLACGRINSDARCGLGERLQQIFDGLLCVMEEYRPDEAAIEEIFVNRNGASTLKLGMARGVVLLVPTRCGVPVCAYSANTVKQSVVGMGHAKKLQVQRMVMYLLEEVFLGTEDAMDALAIALCHVYNRRSVQRAYNR